VTIVSAAPRGQQQLAHVWVNRAFRRERETLVPIEIPLRAEHQRPRRAPLRRRNPPAAMIGTAMWRASSATSTSVDARAAVSTGLVTGGDDRVDATCFGFARVAQRGHRAHHLAPVVMGRSDEIGVEAQTRC